MLLPRAGEDRQRRRRPAGRGRGHHRAAYGDQTGFLLANCHGIMHTVAREYALRTQLTLAKLMDNLPRDQRPGLLRGLRPRARDRGRAGDRALGPDGGQQALRRVRDALPALQLHARLRACVHAAQQRLDPAVAADVRAARLGRRARLLAGRLPRLLVRGQRARRHEQAQGCGDRPARAVRRAAAAFVRTCWYRAFVETPAHAQRLPRRSRVSAAASRASSARPA